MALTFEDRRWSYRELDEASTRVAGMLLGSCQLKKGDRVAAFGKSSDAYVILWLAVVKAGLIHVPVNFALTGRELAYLVNQSGAKAIFIDAPLQAAYDASGLTAKSYDLRGEVLRQSSPALGGSRVVPTLNVDVQDTDIAQHLYTSGTTSEPKGAILTHRALVRHYSSSAMALDARASDRQLHALPLYHSAQKLLKRELKTKLAPAR